MAAQTAMEEGRKGEGGREGGRGKEREEREREREGGWWWLVF